MKSANSPYLYVTEQAAHDDLMLLAVSVIKEIRANGGKPPPVGRMIRDLDKLWEVYKLFAPRGHYESPSRA